MEEEVRKYLEDNRVEYTETHEDFDLIKRPGTTVFYLNDKKMVVFIGYGDYIMKDLLMLEGWKHITLTDEAEIPIKLANL